MKTWIRTTATRGSHVIEFVIIAPAVLLIIGVMIVGGHVYYAHQKVEHAAAEAARAASIARPGAAAAPAAEQAAVADMTAQGLVCTNRRINTDVAAFSTDPGTPGTVSVTITCTVDLNVLAIPGISGSRTITHTAISPVDTYRERIR